MNYTVHAFYAFFAFPDFREVRQPLRELCDRLSICGTILLAPEGMNATIAGSENDLAVFWEQLRRDARFASIEPKVSQTERQPFRRMKVRLKKEIVTLGVPGIDPTRSVGTYVKPGDWNALISRPDVLVIDTRNRYEVEAGSFRGAIHPDTRSFREFPHFVETRLDPEKAPAIAMYCTGGIRCEKATAYMLSRGFSQVFHLEGGILKYLETVPATESLWEGECFVFDERETLDHNLQEKSDTAKVSE
jgi:UPF0176 protein